MKNLETIAARRKELKELQAKLDTLEVSETSKVLQWKKIVNELDVLEDLEESIKEVFERGKKLGYERAKLKGEIKGEISKIKTLIKYEMSSETFTNDLKFLTQEKVKDKLESNLTYIKEHIDDSDSDICEQLGLIGNLSDFEGQIYEDCFSLNRLNSNSKYNQLKVNIMYGVSTFCN